MEFTFNVLFFFLMLSAAMGHSKSEAEEDAEATRRFHVKEHEETRRILKSDMDGYFSNLWQMMMKSNADTFGKLIKNQDALAANLSREFQRKIENLYLTLSKTFEGKLLRSESKVRGEVGGLNQTLHKNQEQLSRSLSNLTASLTSIPLTTRSTNVSALIVRKPTEFIPIVRAPVKTGLEVVSEMVGTIEFDGEANPHLNRKIWIFKSKSIHSYYNMNFVLEVNDLRKDARLSIWNSFNGDQHVWNGSQKDWRTARRTEGSVILVTLTIPSSAAKRSSFKLKFKGTTKSDAYAYTNTIVGREGPLVVSFPPNNNESYPTNSLFTALITSPNGSPVQLNLRYLDIPGTPPDQCETDFFFVWFLDEGPNGTPYKKFPSSAVRKCGRAGDIFEPIGNATVAILRFITNGESVGKGFRVDVIPA